MTRCRWSTCKVVVLFLLVAGFASAAHAADAQPPASEVRARYERAVAWQNYQAAHFVLNQEVYPFWIEGNDSFWYKRETEKGYRIVIVDAAHATRAEAFDHAKLAAHLAKATDKSVDAEDLPISWLSLALSSHTAAFRAFGKDWSYDIAKDALEEVKGATKDRQKLLISPDGTRAAFRTRRAGRRNGRRQCGRPTRRGSSPPRLMTGRSKNCR